MEENIQEQTVSQGEQENKTEEISYPVQTSVIQANNLTENYNTIYKSIKIKNETKFNLSQSTLTPDIGFTNKKDVIIFHTHTCESYTRNKRKSLCCFWKL